MIRRTPAVDTALGWWMSGPEDRLPYRASVRGVFFSEPGAIVGVDLRKAKEPSKLRLTRPPAFIVDGKAANEVLGLVLDTRCPSCGSTRLALDTQTEADDQVLCNGCGGMFEMDAFVAAAGYPAALDWAARLEGRWASGDDAAVSGRGPAMVSAKGTQAARAALAVAQATSLRAFRPGEIDDAGLASLGAQPRLEALDLWYTRVTGEGLAAVRSFTTLRHLNAGNNRSLGDEAAPHIAELAELRTLTLEQTALGDVGLAVLAQRLPALEVLILNATPVTDEGLAALRGHPALRRLALGWTKITDAGLAHLRAIPTLEMVDTWDCPVSVVWSR